MLNEQAVTALIAALESGRYSQTTCGALRCADRFCALGVACDLVKEQVHGEWRGRDEDYFALPYDVYGHEKYPPPDVLKLYGFSDDIGTTLVLMNDAGQTFNAIAATLRALLAEQNETMQ
jgi:hypothetical protein